MRKLAVNSFITLDGIMQAPGGPDEDPKGGFIYGGWSVNYWDDIMGKVMDDFMSKPFDLLLGRKTYEIFASYWPYAKNNPTADVLNNIKKYVASGTLTKVDWNNSTLIKGDIVQGIKKLKSEDGPEIQVHGSSNLIQTLLKNKLIDLYRIWIFPVTVGKGKRLFDEGTVPASFTLIDTKIATSGVIIADYEPGGELKTGSFALENPSSDELKRRERIKAEEKL